MKLNTLKISQIIQIIKELNDTDFQRMLREKKTKEIDFKEASEAAYFLNRLILIMI